MNSILYMGQYFLQVADKNNVNYGFGNLVLVANTIELLVGRSQLSNDLVVYKYLIDS